LPLSIGFSGLVSTMLSVFLALRVRLVWLVRLDLDLVRLDLGLVRFDLWLSGLTSGLSVLTSGLSGLTSTLSLHVGDLVGFLSGFASLPTVFARSAENPLVLGLVGAGVGLVSNERRVRVLAGSKHKPDEQRAAYHLFAIPEKTTRATKTVARVEKGGPRHPLFPLTVAPFRAWRGSQLLRHPGP